MTVAALVASIDYVENGVTTSFPVPFRFKAAAHVRAVRFLANGTKVDLSGADYTVTGGETDAGGALTVAAPAVAGTRLRILRRTPRAQPMVYTTGDRFPAASHEQALDNAVLMIQEVDADVTDVRGRALLLPPGESLQPLPAAAGRAGRFIGFGVDANVPLMLSGTGTDGALRGDLAGASGAALTGFAQPSTDAVTTSLLAEARRTVWAEQFGAIGDGVTDNILALERARNFLISQGGGVLRIGCGRFAISRDFVVAVGNVMVRGSGARSTTIVNRGGGVYSNALVRIGGNVITFSNGIADLSITWPNGTKPGLLVVGTQEDSVFERLVVEGPLVAPMRVWSIGKYSGGAAANDPVHKSRFADLHIITGFGNAGDPTNGLELVGCSGVCPERCTVTVPPVSDNTYTMPQTKIGATGLLIGEECKGLAFSVLHVEGFARPIDAVGPNIHGCLVDTFTFSSVATPPAGAIAVNIAAGADAIDILNLLSIDLKYDVIVSVADTAYTIPKAQLVFGALSHLRVWRSQANKQAFLLVGHDSDHAMRETREITYLNRRLQGVWPITVNLAVPDVGQGDSFFTLNTADTTIASFTSGSNGQTISILVSDDKTSFGHGAGIVTTTRRTFKARQGSRHSFYFDNGSWYELGRADSSIAGQVTYDPPSLVDGAGVTTTVAAVGAVVGDYAQAAFAVDTQGITVTAWVSAADTVSVRLQNETGGTLDIAGGTLRVRVIKA